MTTNHTDLIRRLRDSNSPYHRDTLHREAADALEAMQADAARYRWLRKMLNGDGFRQQDALLAACQDDMDAAIDSAIAAGAQK